ncbi:MAG: signal peptidase II [Lentisphaerae bacterium]|nr:signal peptidase II [Lentisphaerota bacterium]
MKERLTSNSPAEKRVLVFSAIIALAVLVSDFLTKIWVIRCFKLHESVELIPGLLAFTSVRNYGAAWSILSGHVWLLFAFAVVAAVLLVVFFRKICEGCPERYFALLLLLAGIVGNAFDRIYRGAVVDFIHVHWHNVWHYPIFNVADIAICCGVGIFILSNCLRKSSEKEEKK